jgi:TonB family protein
MRLTALSVCGLMLLLLHAAWAEAPPSTQPPAQPRSTTSTRTATKALVSTSTTTSVGRVAGLSKEEIGAVIRRNLPRFKYCYEKKLAGRPELAGKIAVSFKIGPTGAVADASVRSTSMNNVDVEACTVGVIRSLKFPPPRNGGVVVVTYPLVFQSE